MTINRATLLRRLRATGALAGLALCLVAGWCAPATAAEIKVLSGRVFRPVLEVLLPEFERATGHKVAAKYGRGKVVRNYIINNNRVADLVILPRPLLSELAEQKKVVASSMVDIARSELGVGVRSGTPMPDTGSRDGFRQLVLSAKVIVCADPRIGAASTGRFMDALRGLAILDEVQPKIRMVPDEHTADYVMKGEADMAVQAISELLAVPGIDAIAFPPGLQNTESVLSAGVEVAAAEPALAKALIEFLTSPRAVDVIRMKHLNPG